MRYHRTHKFVSLAVAISVLMTVSSFVYADETDVEEEPVVDTSVVEDIQPTEEPEETEETTESAETVESVEPEEIDIEEEIVYEETVVIDNGYDNDFLAEQFIAQRMSAGSEPLLRSYNYASQLSDYNLMLFTALQPHIIAVANGTESSTIFVIDIGSFTAADLGLESITTEVNSQGQTVFTDEVKTAIRNKLDLSTATVIDALLNACPYDLYWYDKTAGCSVGQSFRLSNDVLSISCTFQFSVAQEYAGSSAYTVDTSIYGQALSDAVVNARAIIDRYAADSDYDKLSAYRDEICDLASYNHAAADDNNNTPYGNPWQMIWVFDGDPNTTVVCEGYSKAFQFLCDNSNFQSDDIYAICVSGPLYTSSGSGGHMWNIVHMEDGYNYLVDVTNCDTGHALFLRGWSEYPENSGIYQVSGLNLNYGYDIDTLTYYNLEDLTLNTDDYDPSSVIPTGVEINETNFPDANFRSYVSINCDTDDNGYLSDDEIEAVTIISVPNRSITRLDGIKFFTSLEVLSCDQNLLTSIDVSGMSSLESLVCKSNQITSINVSGCPSLMLLDCHGNSLASLNIISCPNVVSAYTTGTRSQSTGYSTYQNASGTLTVDDSVNVIASTTVSVAGVTLNQSTLSLTAGGNTATLEATVLPENATDKSVTWSSTNESVATVSSEGVVTPVSVGSTTITVTTTDGCFTSSCIVSVTSSVVPTGVEINSTSFPDEIIRNWVSENCDSDSDGYLSPSEISAVTEIVVTYKDIRNLTGIEYFTELVRLDCSDNLLTSLDVSHNTKLEYLNVSTYFMKLYQHMTGNQITSLDLSNNPNLTYLNCNYNALTSLDLRNNPLLTHLEAESYNYLVSGESDYVRVTPPLTSIDISNNSLLEYVDLAMNELTSLDLSGYTHLEYLRCDGNDLYELNVDGCTNLKELDCGDNDLTGIDVRSCSRLESLGIALNPMPHLDVNGMTSLKRLTGFGCGMITIDISGCSSLMYLDCHRNSLSIINVSDSPCMVCAYVNGDYSSDPWDRYSYNAGSGDEAVHYEIMANTGCIIKVSELVPGWDTADGHGCYVNPDGTYATGVQTIEGSVYCFADDGVMFTDGWVTVNGARYYCQSNGKAYVNTTQVIDGVTYVFDNQGKCVSETPVVSSVNMYRLYNPNSGEHFYTSNAGERDLLASLGWHDEGIGWIAPAHSNTPVYRLYNENGGEHHYTTSVAERDMLVSLGWNDEGIGWYSDDAHTVPLYRQYNPNSFANNHNYTTSLGENDWLVSIGWRAEGIGWYGVG